MKHLLLQSTRLWYQSEFVPLNPEFIFQFTPNNLNGIQILNLSVLWKFETKCPYVQIYLFILKRVTFFLHSQLYVATNHLMF